ncbi:MAG: radical SAM protein [Candidatus Omnitrophota bacterium]
MKVLLVNFNIGSTPGINNGLAILSAVLKRKGCEVSLIFLCDELGYGLDLERIRRDVISFSPNIIGLSLMETQLKYAVKFCDDLKNYYGGFVVCGGPYPTMDPEGCFSLRGLDAVCVGEGEDALLELASALESKKDYTAIRNLWFKLPGGAILKNRLRPFKELNDLPLEDKEIFDLGKILPLKNYQLEVMLGRGCAYQCSYCINRSYMKIYEDLCEHPVTMRDYIRTKAVGTAIEEIKNSVLRHPEIRKLAFIDDNFLMYKNFLEEFCERYKNEIALPFMCNVNPLSYNASKAKILRDAGCDDVRFGVESGSERIKKDVLNRPMSNRSVMDAFRINNELGLMTSSFNMIGLPTETKEEVLETLRLNAGIMPDTVKVMTFYPFKSTPIYGLCEKLELIDYDKKFELDNYDTFTSLKFPAEHQLFLKKIQSVFNWYLNLFMDNEASPEYAAAIKEAENMSEGDWDRFDYRTADEKLSREMTKRGIPHYAKFVNRSLAVKFPSRRLN